MGRIKFDVNDDFILTEFLLKLFLNFLNYKSSSEKKKITKKFSIKNPINKNQLNGKTH